MVIFTALAWLVPHETVAISVQVLCTPYNQAPCHFMQSHILKVYACLAVTCHLQFWQNDWDLLLATAVTWGCNRYRNKSQSEGGESSLAAYDIECDVIIWFTQLVLISPPYQADYVTAVICVCGAPWWSEKCC